MRPRLEDVACAICMDSLFTAKDDLDEVLPVAAPDCGHVFHEKCLLDWFNSQIQQYIATARERGWDHERDPAPGDVPVECPQCRAEVYADEDDDKPLIHRLYINFGEASATQAPSSQVGSSPMGGRSAQLWGNPVEREALGIARRAKGAAEELRGLGAQSSASDMNGTLQRLAKIQEDVLSAKASTAFKKYIGGLTVAINTLRDKLESDPTIAGLQADIKSLREARANAERRVRHLETIDLPQARQAGVMEERKRVESVVTKAHKQHTAMRLELNQEKVTREAIKRAAEEREEDLRRQLQKANSALEQSHLQAHELKKTLQERTSQLKLARSKLEARRGLKDKLADLEDDNARLRDARLRAEAMLKSMNRSHHGASSRESQPGPSSREPQPSSPLFTPPRHRPAPDSDDQLELGPTPRSTQDESLLVEEPFGTEISLDFDAPRKPARSTTARSFKMDLDSGLVKDKKSKSKYFAADAPRQRSPKVLVADSSPLRNKHTPPRKRPYSPARRNGTSTEDAIELSPSPRRTGPLRTISREQNKHDFLQQTGLVDARGRPRKTLATVRPGKL